MSSDPGSKDPGGGSGDDPAEKKTRFVPRPDLAKPTAESPSSSEDAPAVGAVIGRTRLIGSKDQVSPAGGGVPTPTARMASAKTELIRGEGVESEPVAGWVVVVKGPGRGGFRPVFVGMNSVGRDPGQRVSLSFGDESISREEHAFITFDEESRTFYLQHGGKSNLVRLGNDPVLTPTELPANALIRIGKTTLMFVPCCGPDFSWADEVQGG
jgi:FHA domain-containing protein